MPNNDKLKQLAAEKAVTFIQSGMIVGLGHGSTAIHAVRSIAHKIKNGDLSNIFGIPCSKEVELEAIKLGIPLTTLAEHPQIDATIDGADEVDPALELIKGGGGALLREKIVAQASRREIIIVDYSKISPALGTKFAVPVEVITFGWQSQKMFLESLGAKVSLRLNRERNPFITDHHNYILDCQFGPISDLYGLDKILSNRAGIVESGLFLGLATDVIISRQEGLEHKTRDLNS